MRVSITAPDLGGPAALSHWYARVGDRVFEGDRVAELLIPGATFDVSAPTTGVLLEQAVRPHDPVTAGTVLGTIEEERQAAR